MDYTSVAIIGVVGLIVLWVLWAARGRSGLDRPSITGSDDPYVHRGEPGNPEPRGGGN